ncbi:MAG: TIGR02099 family protein [Pseudomonadota bacterium]|nr:TIGR02099 family protein [Pseudomonadota bacterium]
MESTLPSLPALPALPSRRLRWLALILRALLWLAAAGWLLFGLSWFVFHGWIVPRIGEFRPRLELEASRALGVPVRIGSISAHSLGAMPSFELHDVRLLDAQGREAVRLPRLVGALSPASLWGLGFEQLVIESPELDIRRARDGRVFVGGLEVSRDRQSGDSALADWLFSQTEFVLRGGTVRWSDELRQAPPLALRQVDAVMKNGRHRHLMRLDATPPSEWGQRFSLRGIFKRSLLSVRAGDFDAWSGQLYGEFGRVDVSRFKQYASLASLGIGLNRGQGALRAWVDVSKGKIAGALADVALEQVDVRLGERLQPLAFESLAGRIGASQHARGFELRTEGLRFRTQSGLRWPGGNVALVHTTGAAGAPAHTTFKADRLDLAALAQIASRLPLGQRAQALIASFAPEGLVDVLDARWQGPLDTPTGFAAQGRVSALRLASLAAPAGSSPDTPGRPGVSGASADFELTEAGGQARVSIVKGALMLPGVFEEPALALDQLSTEAQWKLSGARIELQLRNLQFANADAQGQAQVRWRTDDSAAASQPLGASRAPDRRFPGVLDLQGSLSRGEGGRVHRYLPLVLAPEVRHYVRDAVLQGQVSEVKFKVAGRVEDIPFASPAQGDFRVSAKVRNGHFVYVPKSLQPPGALPWPALTELGGELVFNRAALEVNGASGKVAGLPGLRLLKGEARIPDLMDQATVEVSTDIQGALSDALGFVNTSPLAEMTGQALAQATASGSASYRFRLRLPIDAIETSRVEGTIALPGNDVRFAPDVPALAGLKGTVNLSEKGFAVAGAQARLFGGEVRIDGGTRAQPPAAAAGQDSLLSVAFKAQGQISAEGLRQASELGLLSRLAQHTSGSTAYSASLLWRRGVPEITVTSSLQGLALNLPAPLNKTAEALLPVRFDNALVPASLAPGQALQDQLSLSIGRLASLGYLRDVSGAQPRVIRGSLGVGLDATDTVPLPESGVRANIRLAQLDVDAWEKLLADVPGASLLPPPAPVSGAPARVPGDAAQAMMGYLPSVIAVRAGELRVQGQRLNQVVVGGQRDGLNWRANIEAAELNGYLEYRQSGPAGPGRVHARLSRLSLAPGTASEVEALLDEQPASIPALDIVVDNLELRGRKLGRIEIDAVNRGASGGAGGGVREWHLNKFNVILPEASLSASGDWVAVAPVGGPGPVSERRRAVMDFRLDIADSGELLKRFGMDGVLRRGKGQLEGQVAWMGSPLSPHLPSLNGQLNVNVASGQFMKAEPGLAKLLGVLSLQSLPRRLALDFRDVFSQGFAFDFVRGDVTIAQGLASTNNLQMSGVNAAVLMAGSADIVRETQRLRVVVVPEINAGTASLIATAINPAIGLGSFLAQMFLRRPLMEAATQEFQIDGAWSEPKITKIDRRARPAGQANIPSSVETP